MRWLVANGGMLRGRWRHRVTDTDPASNPAAAKRRHEGVHLDQAELDLGETA